MSNRDSGRVVVSSIPVAAKDRDRIYDDDDDDDDDISLFG